MTGNFMNPNTQPSNRRHWLRWLLYLSPFLLAPPLFLAGFIAYNILRPLPDFDAMSAPASLQPAPAATSSTASIPSRDSSKPIKPSTGFSPHAAPTGLALASRPASASPQTSATLQVPPPWPPFRLDAVTSPSLAERFARLHDQIEACRRDCEAFAAVSPHLDLASNDKRIKALAQAVEDADEAKDDIRDNLDPRTHQRLYATHGPLDEAGQRINALRDIHIRFRLDHAIRAGDWQTAGILQYPYMRDLDRAIFYWRKDGMRGYLMIGQASFIHMEQAFYTTIEHSADELVEGVDDAWKKAH